MPAARSATHLLKITAHAPTLSQHYLPSPLSALSRPAWRCSGINARSPSAGQRWRWQLQWQCRTRWGPSTKQRATTPPGYRHGIVTSHLRHSAHEPTSRPLPWPQPHRTNLTDHAVYRNQRQISAHSSILGIPGRTESVGRRFIRPPPTLHPLPLLPFPVPKPPFSPIYAEENR